MNANTAGMHIRPYHASDIQAVTSLWRACDLTRPWNDPLEDIARKLTVQPELFFIGEVGAHIVASVMAGFDGHRGWVNYLAVLPAYRRQGHGEALMRHVEQALLAMGCSKLNLQVRSANGHVLDFYRAIGYVQDDVVSMGRRLITDGPG